MIKLTKQDVYGYVEYAITNVNELEELPKRGIANGSICILYGEIAIRKYRFFQENENEDGRWVG